LQKKGKIGYDGNKKVKGIKISTLTDKNGLPLSVVNVGLEMPNYGGIKVLRYISTYLILS
jgi:hypothetical protein